MGLLDRYLKRFLKAPDPVELPDEGRTLVAANETEQSVDVKSETPSPRANRGDAEIDAARESLSASRRGRSYATGEEFRQTIKFLDEIGRGKAADSLLADALLIAPHDEVKKNLVARLLDRGERELARPLLNDLMTRDVHIAFAAQRLAEIEEASLHETSALAYYEIALAHSYQNGVARQKVRELSKRNDAATKDAERRANLTKMLGARAAGSRYAVRAEVGRGGAATVFLASDRVTAREVALKIFHRRGSAAERRRRLLKEAQVSAAFDHPHIVPILDVDADRDMLVMQLCDGGSLRHRMRQGPLSERDTTDIGTVVLRTLVDIHAAGKTHLDMKPSNLLFHQKRPMICDFGSAGMHELGSAAGTRAYMAPEQIVRGDVGAAADIFSTALMLHECFEGTPFVRGAAEGNPDVRLTQVPIGPRRRALELVLTDFLNAEPAKRPSSVDAVSQWLLAAAFPEKDSEGVALHAQIESLVLRNDAAARPRLRTNVYAQLLLSDEKRTSSTS